MAELRVTLAHSGEPFVHELTNGEIKLGKHVDNDIVIADGRVSRFHATIKREGDRIQIRDPKSLNGTTINGVNLPHGEWKVIAPGDRIILAKGAATLELMEEEPPSEAVSFEDLPVDIGATVFRSADQIIEELPASDATRVVAGGTQAALKELVRLNSHLEKQAERIKLLSKLNQALGGVSQLSLENIYDRSIELLFKFTPADRCLILLLNQQDDGLQPACARSRPERANIRSIPVSRTITNRVREERQSLLWSQLAGDSGAIGTLAQHGIHSVMCAPLIGRQALLGVMYLDRQSPTEAFEVDHLELLNTVAGPTAIAIDNALAFEQLRREELTRAVHNRFLPPHLVDKLIASPDAIQLGGVNRVVTILYSDIRGFTPMAEKADPQQVVALLNDYFTVMTDIIFDHHGTLDKFIGDGLMALFGAPESSPQDALNAVRAAIEMQKRMVTLAQELTRYDFPPIGIGIGVNTGEVTVGYIGSERRTDYTAIGDAVNLASRLEGHAAKGKIIITEATAGLTSESIALKSMGSLQVKGKTDLVEVYEVLWHNGVGSQ